MFRFKNFSLSHHRSTLKIGTDSVLLSALVPIGHKTNILDIGTGCGIIAFCLADKHRKLTIPPTQILGIDIDKDSIKEADENNSTFPPIQNLSVNFRKESVQDLAQNGDQTFDLIVSNPPYFSASLKPATASLEKSKHRDDNLSFQDLINSIIQLLDNNGEFYLILPVAEFAEFEKLTRNRLFLKYYCQIHPKKNKPVNRIVAGFQKIFVGNFTETTLAIRDETGNYTKEYRQLTEEFYWNLK